MWWLLILPLVRACTPGQVRVKITPSSVAAFNADFNPSLAVDGNTDTYFHAPASKYQAEHVHVTDIRIVETGFCSDCTCFGYMARAYVRTYPGAWFDNSDETFTHLYPPTEAGMNGYEHYFKSNVLKVGSTTGEKNWNKCGSDNFGTFVCERVLGIGVDNSKVIGQTVMYDTRLANSDKRIYFTFADAVNDLQVDIAVPTKNNYETTATRFDIYNGNTWGEYGSNANLIGTSVNSITIQPANMGDALRISEITFSTCKSITSSADLRSAIALCDGCDMSDWTIPEVILSGLYRNDVDFNTDLSTLNTAGVTQMISMFNGATKFNQPIGDWDVSGVTQFGYMFKGATAFNQDLSGWDVSSATNMGSMFMNAAAFRQDLSTWDVNGIETWQMIHYACSFDCTMVPPDPNSWLNYYCNKYRCAPCAANEGRVNGVCATCPAGTSADTSLITNTSLCVECPMHTYNDAAGSSCTDCPYNTVTVRRGAVSSLECVSTTARAQFLGTVSDADLVAELEKRPTAVQKHGTCRL